jgi:SpoVK/Ycf46/Vps4 family AAA+-type ATPase
MSSHEELVFHLRSLSRVIYYVTDEEDRFLVKLRDTLKKHADRCWVFNATLGLVTLKNLITDWTSKQHAVNREQADIHSALEHIYKDDPKDERNFYVFTDPERWLNDAHVNRRFMNIIHQVHQDIRTLKILIFVGTRKQIPACLEPYVEVIQDTGLTSEEIMSTVEAACKHLPGVEPPPNCAQLFAGMNSYQIDMAVAKSIVATKKDESAPKRIDPAHITKYRRNHLKKTDLLQLLDVDNVSFDQLGGNHRFKEWAIETKDSWSEEGRAFGLKPPKGVLLVGVWGCGKSLASKAMAREWGMPVVQLEMGKLRSANVGQSEANVYKAIRHIESIAPCVVWIDEAEKSLGGGASSAASDAGTTSRTIGILSTWLQETTSPICLALTANSLKTLPIEFVNRMDERFFFDIPSEEERIEILRIHLRKAGQNPSDYQLAALSDACKGMVGREIEQAVGAGMRKSFKARSKKLDETILLDIAVKKPRILKTMVDEIRELVEWVGFDTEANEGIKARLASAPSKGSSFKLVE